MNLLQNIFKKSTPKEHTIFIVEDNEAYAMLLEKFLILHFPEIHAIKKFTSGEACLNESFQIPAVIIMDHLLNKNQSDAATGLSIIKKMKTANPHLNIILLSAQSEIEVVSKTIAKYGCVYIHKDEDAFHKIEHRIKQFLKS